MKWLGGKCRGKGVRGGRCWGGGGCVEGEIMGGVEALGVHRVHPFALTQAFNCKGVLTVIVVVFMLIIISLIRSPVPVLIVQLWCCKFCHFLLMHNIRAYLV